MLVDRLVDATAEVGRLVRESEALARRSQYVDSRLKAFLDKKELLEEFQAFCREMDESDKDGQK